MDARARSAAALALNVAVFPGVGSLVAGRRVGWMQAGLAAAGLIGMLGVIGPLTLRPSWTLVGFALLAVVMTLVAWAWGVATGVRLVRAARL